MVDIIKYLLESGPVTVSLVLGVILIVAGVVGKYKDIVVLSQRQRTALVVFGLVLLLVLPVDSLFFGPAPGSPASTVALPVPTSTLSPTTPTPRSYICTPELVIVGSRGLSHS